MGRVAFLFLCLLWLPLFAAAQNFSSDNFTVSNPVIATGGYSTSSSFTLQSIVGGFALGTSTSSTYGINSGFLFYPFVTTPVVSATAGDAEVALSWTAASAGTGWSVGSYSVGQSTSSSGPYSFSNVGSVVSSTRTGLTNGTTYYFVIRVNDALGNAIATSSEVSSSPASSGSGGSGGGGGGGGSGGTGGYISPGGSAKVALSGRAYPGREVTVLKDAQVVTTGIADAAAKFQVTVSNLSGGNYIFSVYSEDTRGNRSSLLTFPVGVTAGATTNITGIFIAPTINVDKSSVKQGDNLAIFGQSSPQSEVTININSETALFAKALTDGSGAYLYNLDTTPLEKGDHTAKSKVAASGEISSFGAAVGFIVGNQNIVKEVVEISEHDLNRDGHVNLVDFSILVYWYQRTFSDSGLKADLNKDKKVDLVDFSILASRWTG